MNPIDQVKTVILNKCPACRISVTEHQKAIRDNSELIIKNMSLHTEIERLRRTQSQWSDSVELTNALDKIKKLEDEIAALKSGKSQTPTDQTGLDRMGLRNNLVDPKQSIVAPRQQTMASNPQSSTNTEQSVSRADKNRKERTPKDMANFFAWGQTIRFAVDSKSRKALEGADNDVKRATSDRKQAAMKTRKQLVADFAERNKLPPYNKSTNWGIEGAKFVGQNRKEFLDSIETYKLLKNFKSSVKSDKQVHAVAGPITAVSALHTVDTLMLYFGLTAGVLLKHHDLGDTEATLLVTKMQRCDLSTEAVNKILDEYADWSKRIVGDKKDTTIHIRSREIAEDGRKRIEEERKRTEAEAKKIEARTNLQDSKNDATVLSIWQQQAMKIDGWERRKPEWKIEVLKALKAGTGRVFEGDFIEGPPPKNN